ncbi:MAG TPA: lipopolysaccharide kinase InaA family protein [Gammaproteobacteria bacterium]|nr:lipopolysaccharide kinase InaA family protein [Gammaproteobacteria bacterium]
MFRKYKHKTPSRQASCIKTTDGNEYIPIGRPGSGNSAYTRFFGTKEAKKFIVKRPKYFDQFGEYDEAKLKVIENTLESEYRSEQHAWNLLYPEMPAQLITEGGLRLILPFLPGETLTSCISNDELTRCQQLLSAAIAVQQLHQCGLKYSDFNTDNILIKQKHDGTFRAYLIDLNGMQDINNPGGCQELLALNILAEWKDHDTHYESAIDVIKALTVKITTLQKQQTGFSSSPN